MLSEERATEFIAHFLVNQARIYAFVRRQSSDSKQAEEMFQQVAATLWAEQESFDPNLGTFHAWALQNVERHLRDFQQHRRGDGRPPTFLAATVQPLSDVQHARRGAWHERWPQLARCMRKTELQDVPLLEPCCSASAGPTGVAAYDEVPLPSLYRQLHRARKFMLNCSTRVLQADESSAA